MQKRIKIIFYIAFATLSVFIISFFVFKDKITDIYSDRQLLRNEDILDTREDEKMRIDYKLKVLGWVPYWDQERATESFRNNADKFDYISFFWYYIDEGGKVRKYQPAKEDLATINFAKSKGVKVLAVVTNLPDYSEGGDWDWRRVNVVLGNKQSREKHIRELLELVERKGFDGIDIDYEALKKDQREEFSLFIKEISEVFHGKGKEVGVAIHPRTSEFDPNAPEGYEAQDLVKLSQSADRLYLMTYEEHNSADDPGPIGSLSWSSKVVSYVNNKLNGEGEKIFLGIPLYGYDWNTDRKSLKALEFAGVQEVISTYNPKISYLTDIGEKTFEYENDGLNHEVWFNDADTSESKIELAKQNWLGGVAFWRLGGEDESIWKEF